MFINDLTVRVVFGILGCLPGLGVILVWKRHRQGELTLNADGIFYTGWKRPLRFQEVEKIFARRNYSNVTLTFRLKGKQPPIWKCSLIRLPTKAMNFSLSNLGEKPATMAQTIFRYMTRQTEPDQPAAKTAKAN